MPKTKTKERFDYALTNAGWFPASVRFAEALIPASNYAYAYIYATFLTLSGHLMGRNAYIGYATELYPNFYTCLVGGSAVSHKSTAMNHGLKSLGEAGEGLRRITSLTTTAGLYNSMKSGDGSCLVHLDELANLLDKANRAYSEDVIETVTELYGCPKLAGNFTKVSPVEVHDTFLSILSGSTVEWLQRSLDMSKLMGGFGNRMTFVLGDPRTPNDWPGMPEFEGLANWHNLFKFEGEVVLDQDARAFWSDFYADFTKRQNVSTPFFKTMAERIPEKVLKTVLVEAAWEGIHVVDQEMLGHAINWGQYLYRCLEELGPSFEDAEKQVLQAIEKGYHTTPQLFGYLQHSLGVRRLRDAMSNLKWLGLVEEDEGRFSVLDKPT